MEVKKNICYLSQIETCNIHKNNVENKIIKCLDARSIKGFPDQSIPAFTKTTPLHFHLNLQSV